VSRRTRLLLFVLLAAALFRLPGLDYPKEEYFDEVYHAKTAAQYLRGEAPTEWVHPPTAKLLIAGGVALFGYESWAWRLAPALAGILLAPVFLLLARSVLATERAALLATLLLLLDGVYLVQSRIAMTNVFAVLFQLLSALLLLRAVLERRLAVRAMALAGLALGPMGPTILSVAGDRYRRGTGAVFGVMLSLGQIGSVVLPWSVAQVARASGFRTAMLVPVAAAVAFAGIAAAAWARRGATGYLSPAGVEAP
jgi:hypothetical protein